MITGKVASLIDERTLVINKGSDDGVKQNMRFMIYAAKGKKIIDPDSKKELGELKIKKRSVMVTDVQKSYAVAETYKYKTINEGGTNSILGVGGYLSPPKYVKKYETFAMDESDRRAIDEERSLVKVGDIVEEIEEKEEEES